MAVIYTLHSVLSITQCHWYTWH